MAAFAFWLSTFLSLLIKDGSSLAHTLVYSLYGSMGFGLLFPYYLLPQQVYLPAIILFGVILCVSNALVRSGWLAVGNAALLVIANNIREILRAESDGLTAGERVFWGHQVYLDGQISLIGFVYINISPEMSLLFLTATCAILRMFKAR
ncbi:hypothetical protein [Sulfitobacter sp. 1A13679]|uniref:hypothetical protein n=1 Tax=Sulfitobacter sp. 1A13679 TaxID=3368597 RepID=UPI0037467D6C